MAHAGRLIAALLLAGARVAAAAGGCGEEAGATGLSLSVQAGRVVVDAVAPGSTAASAVHAGDVLLQANATVLHGCSDWSHAIRDARHDRTAVLLLVERRGAAMPVALLADVWGPEPSAPPEARAAAKPSFPAPPPPPPPLPDTVAVSYEQVRADLTALAPADRPPTSLIDYRHAVSQVRRAIATLQVRQAAPQDAVNALRVALRPFEAAEVAWDAIEGDRERERLMRKVPVADEATAPFFETSPAAAVLDEFPALRVTVVRDPSPGLIETAGLWRPVQARAMLWEQGRTQLATLPASR